MHGEKTDEQGAERRGEYAEQTLQGLVQPGDARQL